MTDGFYRAFEDRYRGSRELIKSRLKVYLPFISPLSKNGPSAEALDLGCGRGEWLEILNEAGFKPKGIDLDLGMLDACIQLGLDVEHGDALTYLSSVPDASLNVVSAFHVVEHIDFEQLRLLADEALRVLRPGGLLILETPNPENIIVATRNFYLDPTHERPIPPQLLAFVAEYSGFARVKILRLQESQDLLNKSDISLHNVMAGVSPDYAIVAQKYASDDVIGLINEPFNVNYGLSLEDLLSLWDSQFECLKIDVQKVEKMAVSAELRAGQAELRAGQAELRAGQAELRAEQAGLRAGQAELREVELRHEINKIHHSRSWKMTKWYRYTGLQIHLLRQYGFMQRCKHLIKRVLHVTFSFLRKHPKIKRGVVNLLHKLGAYQPVYRLYRRVNPLQHSQYQAEAKILSQTEIQVMHPELLPPVVHEIYLKLTKNK